MKKRENLTTGVSNGRDWSEVYELEKYIPNIYKLRNFSTFFSKSGTISFYFVKVLELKKSNFSVHFFLSFLFTFCFGISVKISKSF